MKQPKVCLKCNEILTFCECDESITDYKEFIDYLKSKIDSIEDYARFSIACDRKGLKPLEFEGYLKLANDEH